MNPSSIRESTSNRAIDIIQDVVRKCLVGKSYANACLGDELCVFPTGFHTTLVRLARFRRTSSYWRAVAKAHQGCVHNRYISGESTADTDTWSASSIRSIAEGYRVHHDGCVGVMFTPPSIRSIFQIRYTGFLVRRNLRIKEMKVASTFDKIYAKTAIKPSLASSQCSRQAFSYRQGPFSWINLIYPESSHAARMCNVVFKPSKRCMFNPNGGLAIRHCRRPRGMVKRVKPKAKTVCPDCSVSFEIIIWVSYPKTSRSLICIEKRH